MRAQLKAYWPEGALLGVLLFFALRDLGGFPEAWQDDGLFMIVARTLAEGRGYALPVLGDLWQFPYILGVGPAVIAPSAVMFALFGFSVEAARIPMVGYLIAATVLCYAYARQIGGRRNALWATALLISLSAFINTGKPVLGEVPGFVFLLAGLLTFNHGLRTTRWAVLSGMFFGLAVATKLTFGLAGPALLLVWVVLLILRDKKALKHLTVLGVAAAVTLAVQLPLLGMTDPGFLGELRQYGLAEGGVQAFQVLRTQPELLLRFQYLYFFGALLPLGLLGIWSARKKMGPAHVTVVCTLAILLIVFFLNERGWYRHLLLAHLLLIPFIPAGAYALAARWKLVATSVLALFVIAQGAWQLDYRGSRKSDESARAATALLSGFQDQRMVVTQSEVFARLPYNLDWLFLSEEFQIRSYARFQDLPVTQDMHCLPELRKLSTQQREEIGAARLTLVEGRYFVVAPVPGCTPATSALRYHASE